MDDPVSEMKKILTFIGLRASWDIVDEVVRDTSANSVREEEALAELPGANHAATGHGDAPNIRKATHSTYKDKLNSAAIEFCSDAMRRALPEFMQEKFGLISPQWH
mmetsp:Transcript_37216/g.105016  ORF Transcript_37216/g.105016 Transcript_37216/m.105016 type:complete len:106 (-) Transcript_37216:117-434(-)